MTSPWAAPGVPVKALKWLFMKRRPLFIWPLISPTMWHWSLQMIGNCNEQSYRINTSRMVRISNYSRDVMPELIEETGIEYDGRAQGTLQLFRTTKQMKGSRADPRTAQVAARLGEALSGKDWPGALTLLHALEHRVPDQASIAYNTGLVLKRLGRIDESAASLRLALNRDPTHLDALFELGALDMDRGNLPEAEQGFRRYLAGRPRDVDALLNLGKLLIALKRPQEAIVTLQPMFTEHPATDLAIALATALRDAGDHDGCRTLLHRLPDTPEFAAVRLKILSQGARGRLPINARQLLPGAR